ncbi:MAG: hypothetical protein MJY83_05015 [Bacteroidales bacterium]|nr:hypothetical protein [Bacteroidales bacterium]
MSTSLTIEQWLAGMVDFNLTESTVEAILLNNQVASGTLAIMVSERQRDLCLADLYMWLATSSSSKGGEYVSDGGWQHQKSAKNVVDRAGLRARAQMLYKKWDSEKAEEAMVSMVMRNLY